MNELNFTKTMRAAMLMCCLFVFGISSAFAQAPAVDLVPGDDTYTVEVACGETAAIVNMEVTLEGIKADDENVTICVTVNGETVTTDPCNGTDCNGVVKIPEISVPVTEPGEYTVLVEAKIDGTDGPVVAATDAGWLNINEAGPATMTLGKPTASATKGSCDPWTTATVTVVDPDDLLGCTTVAYVLKDAIGAEVSTLDMAGDFPDEVPAGSYTIEYTYSDCPDTADDCLIIDGKTGSIPVEVVAVDAPPIDIDASDLSVTVTSCSPYVDYSYSIHVTGGCPGDLTIENLWFLTNGWNVIDFNKVVNQDGSITASLIARANNFFDIGDRPFFPVFTYATANPDEDPSSIITQASPTIVEHSSNNEPPQVQMVDNLTFRIPACQDEITERIVIQYCDDCTNFALEGTILATFDGIELGYSDPIFNGNCVYQEVELTLTEDDDLGLLGAFVTDNLGLQAEAIAEIRVIKDAAELQGQLSCLGGSDINNPGVNLTLSSDCEATLTPDNLLSNSGVCDVADDMHITLTLKRAEHVADAGEFSTSGYGEVSASIPGIYKYEITYEDDSCWGYVRLEDKHGPICAPNGDKEPDTYVCGSEEKVEDPSGYDDLYTEVVSHVVVDKHGKEALEPWFDVLEADDFEDCSDLMNVEYTTTVETYCGDFGDDEMTETASHGRIPKGWEVCLVYKRTWNAYDWKGQASVEGCSQYVLVVRPSKLKLDEKFEAECGHGDVTASGPYFYDLPEGQTCPGHGGKKVTIGDGESVCKWSATMTPGAELALCSDQGESCSDAYKQINEWTILDVCNHDRLYQLEQILVYADNEGPIITPNAVSVWTNPFDCTTSMTASFTKMDYCSEVVGSEVTAFYQVKDDHGNVIQTVRERADGMTITLENVPIGVVVDFEYSAWDCCGNMRRTPDSATSEDVRGPVCVANDELEVGLTITDHDDNGNGVVDADEHSLGARIYASQVGEGSKDNCYPVILEVRKVYADGTLGPWGPYVEYEYKDDADFSEDKCVDIQWIDLRVTEDRANGLSTICQSKLVLRDNNAPRVSAPACKVIDCDDKVNFDAPSIWGFCTTGDFKDTENDYHCPTDLSDDCKDATHVIKTYTRTWTYTKMTEHDMFTRTASQTIYVNETRAEKFTFPWDYKEECTDAFPAASSLSEILVNGGCANWELNVDEREFAGDDGACFHIERTYTLWNSCLADANAPAVPLTRAYGDVNNDGKILEGGTDVRVMVGTDSAAVESGKFKYVQIIKIFDNTDPTGSVTGVAGCDVNTDGCDQGTVDFTVNFGDVCSTPSITDWYINTVGEKGGFAATANADGSVTVSGSGLASGDYSLHVRVDDKCGNFAWLTGDVKVTQSDCKKPTVIGLANFTALMENCTVDVWLSDILASSDDNCMATWTYGLELANEGVSDAMPTAQSVTITTAGANAVALWMNDGNGNTQYTVVPVVAQDNAGDCTPDPGNGGGAAAAVAGEITNEGDEMVDDVTIDASGTGFSPIAALVNGLFNLDIPMHSDVTVTPSKNLSHLNGVSGRDLVLLQRHVLGISELTSAYKLIAADVNADDKVNTRDMADISKLILGIYDEFPKVTSWRFIDKAHTFANPTSPWGFPESINYANLEADAQADFIGVKMGDISGNAKASQLIGDDNSSEGTMTIAIDDAAIAAGATHEIAFTAKDFNDFAGYQFSIELAEGVTFQDVALGALPNHSEGNFGFNNLDNGVITTNWTNAAALNLEDGEVLFTISVSAASNMNVSEAVSISSAVTTAEAYNNDLDRYEIATQFNRTEANFALFQNTPNPFSNETTIGFELPTTGAVSLKVMDVAGRVLTQRNGTYTAGVHQITLNKSELGATGVLYYQLDTDAHSATKKMIILE